MLWFLLSAAKLDAVVRVERATFSKYLFFVLSMCVEEVCPVYALAHGKMVFQISCSGNYRQFWAIWLPGTEFRPSPKIAIAFNLWAIFLLWSNHLLTMWQKYQKTIFFPSIINIGNKTFDDVSELWISHSAICLQVPCQGCHIYLK